MHGWGCRMPDWLKTAAAFAFIAGVICLSTTNPDDGQQAVADDVIQAPIDARVAMKE